MKSCGFCLSVFDLGEITASENSSVEKEKLMMGARKPAAGAATEKSGAAPVHQRRDGARERQCALVFRTKSEARC